jgi:hypothetical protein
MEFVLVYIADEKFYSGRGGRVGPEGLGFRGKVAQPEGGT